VTMIKYIIVGQDSLLPIMTSKKT